MTDGDSNLECRAGGIKLISGSKRITLDNTLDERLRLLEDRVRQLFLVSPFLQSPSF